MPHKHKRRAGENSTELYDLPPSSKARPLKTGKSGTTDAERSRRSKRTTSKQQQATAPGLSYGKDDTPRAFQRLLQYQRTGRGLRAGLDEGVEEGRSGKKRKRGAEGDAAAVRSEPAPAQAPSLGSTRTAAAAAAAHHHDAPGDTALPLKIQPHEHFSDFLARVDRALPLTGISTRAKKLPASDLAATLASTQRRTKHDKRLRKLQAGWRAEEARLREREEERAEEAEAAWEERVAGLDREAREVLDGAGWRRGRGAGTVDAVGKGQKKGQKRQRVLGEEADADGEDDPWAVLRQRREMPKGVFDVVQAPPTFRKLPREVFRAQDVPRAAGSLRQREELGQTRADIIKKYRAMMAGKRTVDESK